jgi:3-vinyl bacteriochlorophyllide hydratase
MQTSNIVKIVDNMIARMDMCPWPSVAGTSGLGEGERLSCLPDRAPRPLYTPDQRRRRDASHWTRVQAILAPLQFAVFLASLYLVLSYMATGEGLGLATASIVLKTLVLYTIMITGSLWERDIFGRYLFAPAFFWEDVVSILVLALHTAYLAALLSGAVAVETQMAIALTAYAAYVVNAAQFLIKFRSARLEGRGGPVRSARIELSHR